MTTGVFFDFDGTLADTAPDLAKAINQLLVNYGKTPLDYHAIRPFVSGGSPALIKLGFNKTSADQDFESLKDEFLSLYAQCLLDNTKLFDGIENCLAELDKMQIRWGVITNKPEFLTTPIIAALSLDKRATTIICGDTYSVKKPHPYPLIQACEISNTDPRRSIYVGDDQRDIQAAKAANMISVCAEWGYLAEQDPKNWLADYYVSDSENLIEQIKHIIN